MARLHALPKDVADAVRSQTVLKGLDQVAEELACNALDAGARCVRIWADVQNRRLEVHDDGHGMGREDLLQCGTRHCTSKIRTLKELHEGPKTLGFRGEAMASLAELSTLSICSRKKGSFETYSKTVQGNIVLRFGIEKVTRQEPGTSVYVENFQFNQPVRRKLVDERALHKEVDAMRYRILCLAMSHHECRFQVKEKHKGELIRQDVPVDPFTLFYSGLGKTNTEHFKRATIHENDWILDGIISVPPRGGRAKTQQYIFVNRKVVRRSPVHQMLVQAFQFLCSSLATSGAKVETGALASIGAALPYYALFMRCPPGSFDLLQEQDKSSMEFLDGQLVERLLAKWLLVAWAEVLPSWCFSSTKSSWVSMLATKKFSCARRTVVYTNSENVPQFTCERTGSQGPHARMRPHSTPNQFRRVKKQRLTTGESVRLPVECEGIDSDEDSLLVKWRGHSQPPKGNAAEVCDCCRADGQSKKTMRWRLPIQSDILELAQFKHFDPQGGVIPSTMSRDALRVAHVYCQVDKKFILAKAQGMIFVIDQHAADERVRLEHLQEELRSRLRAGASLAQEVSPPIEMELTYEELTCAELYMERIERWGWKLKHHADDGDITVSMPTKCYVFSAPCICGVMLGEQFLREYLHQLSETCGAQAIPSKINALLKSKACRGAVMFGDELSRNQSKCLVEKLAGTQLSLHCAHGRPTTVPLVQTDALQRVVQTRRSLGRAHHTKTRINLGYLKQQLGIPQLLHPYRSG